MASMSGISCGFASAVYPLASAIPAHHLEAVSQNMLDAAALALDEAQVLVLAIPAATCPVQRARVVLLWSQQLCRLHHFPLLVFQPLLRDRHSPAVEEWLLLPGDLLKNVLVVVGVQAVLLDCVVVGPVVGVNLGFAEGSILIQFRLCRYTVADVVVVDDHPLDPIAQQPLAPQDFLHAQHVARTLVVQ